MPFLSGRFKKRQKDKTLADSSFQDTSTPTKKQRLPSSTQSTPGIALNGTPLEDTLRSKNKSRRSLKDVGNTTEPIYLASSDYKEHGSGLFNRRSSVTTNRPIVTPKIKSLRSQRSPNRSFLNLRKHRSQGDLDDEDEFEMYDGGSILSDADGHQSNLVEPGAVQVPVISSRMSRPDSKSSRLSLEGKPQLNSPVDVEEHMANPESTRKDDLNNSGIFSTILHAAQNAASTIGNIASTHHETDIKSHPPASTQPPSAGQGQAPTSANGASTNNSSFMQHLDTLLFNQSVRKSDTSQNETSQTDQQELNDQASAISIPKSLINEIVFQPIRKTAISTMGTGELTLEDLGFTDAVQPNLEVSESNPQVPQTTLPSFDIDEPTPTKTHNGVVFPSAIADTTSRQGDRRSFSTSQLLEQVNTPVGHMDSSDALPLRPVSPSVGSSNNFRRSLSPSGTVRVPKALDLVLKKQHRKSVSSGTTVEANGAGNPLSNQVSKDEVGTMSAASMPSLSFELRNIPFASEKRNVEFHHLFKSIPKGERLIDDFSCALQREILIQGKMYISESHISFKSNILGWVTNFTIPVQEIVQLEKKTTAGLFHNGIVIQTLHQKYTFASFLSRDSTFELILNIWTQLVRGASNLGNEDLNVKMDLEDLSREQTYDTFDDDNQDELSEYDDTDDEFESDIDYGENSLMGPLKHEPTEPVHKEVPNEKKVIESIIDGPVGKNYQLLFGDNTALLKNILEKQKNYNISPLTGFKDVDGVKKRSYSYVKPLGGPVGPKETLCEVTETIDHCDLKDYVQVTQNTKTPDVPSGNSFSVNTTIYLSWGPKNSTKILVFTYVDWTGKSWIKSAIEKGTIDGQKESIGILVDELKAAGSSGSSEKPEDSNEDSSGSGGNTLPTIGPKTHGPTDNEYKPKQGDTQIVDETLNAPLGTVFELLFGDDTSYYKSIITAQRNFNLTEITGFVDEGGSKKRSYSYTKPLGGPIGPKETRCHITETIETYDLNKYIQVVQVTASPDVPSGNSFTVQTNIYLSWGPNNNTRILVVTSINWTGKSWIKGAIEKGTIDGQKESVGILVNELKQIIAKAESSSGSGGKKKRKRSRSKTVSASKGPETSFVNEVLKDTPSYHFSSFLQRSPLNSFTMLFVVFFLIWVTVKVLAPPPSRANNSSIGEFNKAMIGGKEYYIIPSIDNVLKDTDRKRMAEYDIWEWINKRSPDSQKERKRPPTRNYNEQEMREVIRLTEEKLDTLKRQLDE